MEFPSGAIRAGGDDRAGLDRLVAMLPTSRAEVRRLLEGRQPTVVIEAFTLSGWVIEQDG
jgi:hypothetical protein